MARCDGTLKAGETVGVRLVEADPPTGRVRFSAGT
jgi:hypothetical protein